MKSSVSRKTRRNYDELARKTTMVVLWAAVIILILTGILILVNLYVTLKTPTYETYSIRKSALESIVEDNPVYNVTYSVASPRTYQSMADQYEVEEESAVDDDINQLDYIYEELGQETIEVDGSTLVRYDLPDVYYGDCDFSSFQPYMSYKCITDETTQAYSISHSQYAYTDENGMRRYETSSEQFTINGEDDYVFALGTFYKPRGTCGSRWFVVTTTGAYTAITGDEKADVETDEFCMFSRHGDDGTTLGLIEWIVDYDLIGSDVWAYGSITAGPIEAIQGEILYMYRIE